MPQVCTEWCKHWTDHNLPVERATVLQRTVSYLTGSLHTLESLAFGKICPPIPKILKAVLRTQNTSFFQTCILHLKRKKERKKEKSHCLKLADTGEILIIIREKFIFKYFIIFFLIKKLCISILSRKILQNKQANKALVFTVWIKRKANTQMTHIQLQNWRRKKNV